MQTNYSMSTGRISTEAGSVDTTTAQLLSNGPKSLVIRQIVNKAEEQVVTKEEQQQVGKLRKSAAMIYLTILIMPATVLTSSQSQVVKGQII